MADWFEFLLYGIQKSVSTVFSLDTGLGFSLGDLDLALIVIGVLGSALIVKSHDSVAGASSAGQRAKIKELRAQRYKKK